jgi:hypothetical protein
MTVTRLPATVTFAARCGPAFGATLTWTEAVPDPDAGLTVAHVASDEAVQLQRPLVFTLTSALPPAPASGSDGPATL